MIMNEFFAPDFTDAVCRVPELWGRKILTVLDVRHGMAQLQAAGVKRHWVPTEKLERVGVIPVRTIATRQPCKRSEVC
jgi:hypothetical protein